MSVERNVIITTGEEVVTPQKAERILAACTPARAKGQAMKAAKALEGFLRLQYERGQRLRAEVEKYNQIIVEGSDMEPIRCVYNNGKECKLRAEDKQHLV